MGKIGERKIRRSFTVEKSLWDGSRKLLDGYPAKSRSQWISEQLSKLINGELKK